MGPDSINSQDLEVMGELENAVRAALLMDPKRVPLVQEAHPFDGGPGRMLTPAERAVIGEWVPDARQGD